MYVRKALESPFRTCMGHGGLGPLKKVIQGPTSTGQGFWANFWGF